MFQVGAVIDGGRASAGGTATLTDATKVWGTDLLAGFLVRIISGTGVNQIRQVASNTATVLTVSANWTTNPDATSEYAIFLPAKQVPALPVPLTFADPGTDSYTTAQTPGRDCTRLRVIVGNSGVIISLDGGTTASISLPPNTMDEILVALPSATSIKVKRYTAGTAMTNLIVEVR